MNTLNESMRVAYEIGVTEEEFGLSVSWWDIEQIYKAGMAAEREECAKVADRHSTCKNDTPDVIAVAIRARGRQ